MSSTSQKTQYNLLIVDLESTCWGSRQTPDGEPQSVHNMEVIEIGCALANRQGDIGRTASFLVRPKRHPHLSDFCVQLTGVNQSMVDAAPAFPEAISAMNNWLGELPDDFVWCSWGNYDRQHLEAQSLLDGAGPIISHRPHLNLKRIWRRTTGQKKKNGLRHALAFHDLAFEGNPHRGIDDAKNIVHLLPFMDWALEPAIVNMPGAQRLQALKELSALDQELGLYD